MKKIAENEMSLDLPEEILLHHIFPYLHRFGDLDTLLNAALVCKKWSAVCCELIWSQVLLGSASSVRKFHSILPLVQKKIGFLEYGKFVRNITISLDLLGADMDARSSSLVSEESEFEDSEEEDLDFALNLPFEYEYMKKVYPELIQADFYEKIAECFPNLTGLLLHGCFLDDIQVETILTSPKFASKLRSLVIPNVISLRNNSRNLDILSNLCNFSSISYLCFGSRKLEDLSFNGIIRHLSRLTRLDLSNCDHTKFTDSSLLAISMNCPLISHFSLPSQIAVSTDMFEGITDDGICALVGNCAQITSLIIPSTMISNRGLEFILRNAFFLEMLDVCFSSRINLEPLNNSHIEHPPKLRRLILLDCPRIENGNLYMLYANYNHATKKFVKAYRNQIHPFVLGG